MVIRFIKTFLSQGTWHHKILFNQTLQRVVRFAYDEAGITQIELRDLAAKSIERLIKRESNLDSKQYIKYGLGGVITHKIGRIDLQLGYEAPLKED